MTNITFELDGRFGQFVVGYDDEPGVIRITRQRFSYTDGMHYTPVYVDQGQARELLRLLQYFVDTGNLPNKESEER